MTAVEDNSAFDIISESQMLTCTPIVSCNEGIGNITWESEDFSGITNSIDPSMNGRELSVDSMDYGNYTCFVTSDNVSLPVVTYSLYGKCHRDYRFLNQANSSHGNHGRKSGVQNILIECTCRVYISYGIIYEWFICYFPMPPL